MSGQMWVAVIGLSLTFLLNFAGLVWGAAHLSAAIKSLGKVTDKLEHAVVELREAMGQLSTRVAVLETRHEKQDVA